MKDDLLIEIQTEELPPKALLTLSNAFQEEIERLLSKNQFEFSEVKAYATPRRLALLISNLNDKQPDQIVERRGPSLKASYDAKGNPTKACIGFANSCGVKVEDLMQIKNEQGEWVACKTHVQGQSLPELLPMMVETALGRLPIPKRMHWGTDDALFVRPIHSVILLYGTEVVPGKVLNVVANRKTRGHRFLSKKMIDIPSAKKYADLLKNEGYVIADFNERKTLIKKEALKAVKDIIGTQAELLITSDAFLDEVTGLVEWPVVICGKYDKKFLNLPREVLISSMEDHQRYFPVIDRDGNLLPYFITISNIQNENPEIIIEGNERVLRARLSDAEFFYHVDQKIKLESRLSNLKNIIFKEQLGSLYDKCARLSKITQQIAIKIGSTEGNQAARAGLLAKTDLTTSMVNEFPELQGTMGYYYALHDKEPKELAIALREQYYPRFAGDELPKTKIGEALAIADRLDNLVASFGMMQIPTGDKDPFGLRRAALGVIRIIIENNLNLDLKDLVEIIIASYPQAFKNKNLADNLLSFFIERLRAWYLEQAVPSDVFQAVIALPNYNLSDIAHRINAVIKFKALNASETLSIANKRVSNILAKYSEKLEAKRINPSYFEETAEIELAKELELKFEKVDHLSQAREYEAVLLLLAELREPVDNFFDHVMVMTDKKAQRENRILLLTKLRSLFLQVADIALLQ